MKQTFLSILLMLLPMMASADAVEIGGIWYNLVAKVKEAEVTSNPNKYSGIVEIPASVTYNDVKYKVTSIGISAFGGCRLTSITIPNSVTSIEESAFIGCGLTTIAIPNSVTSIGKFAFDNCKSLTSVTIPNSVASIEEATFYECTALTSVTFSYGLTEIGSSAFYGCTSLTSVNFPNSLTSILNNAFEGCISLTSVTIPNALTTIENNAFSDCSALASVTIGSGVKTISSHAFGNCDELTDVYCLAEKISGSWRGEGLYTSTDAFNNSYPQYMTLHVPAASIEAYRSTEPWSQFKAIVPLEDGDNPEIKKCATPEISYSNGKVSLSCETEGVEFISEVTVTDAKKYYDSEFTLSQTYKISVYATKAGYENSDVATREIVIENGQTTLFGDLDKDGKVNVADHVKLSDIIMNK